MKKRTKLSSWLVVVLAIVMMVCTAFAFTACSKNPSGSSTGGQSSTGGSQSGSGSQSGGGEVNPPEEEVVRIPVEGNVRYDFDVVAGYGKITGTKFNPETNEGVGVSSKEGIGSWITGFTWKNEASATLSVYADKECEVDLGLKVRKTEEIAVLTSKVSVSIGGEVIDSEAEVDKASDKEAIEFDEVNLGRYFLSAGENIIKIVPMDSTDNFSFMSVIVYADDEEANLRWTDLKDVTGKIFYGINEKVTLTGDFNKNYSENCIGVSGYTGATAKFPVYSSRQAKAKISFITCAMPVSNVFTDFYNFSINGTRQHSDARTRNGALWGEYGIVYIGEYLIEKGLNEISITSPAIADYTQHYNFRALIVDTDATIDFDEVSEEAHVCLSVCATCGGCLNDACTEEACKQKCTCEHVCESVCTICGGCKDAECTEEACATKCACEEQTVLAYGNAIVEQGKYDADNNLGCATLDNNTWRTKFRYVIDAKTAGKAELSIVISSTINGSHPATDVFMTTINGKEYKSEAKTVNDGVAWTSFHTIKLGLIDLNEGRNIIAFDHYHITDFATAPVANWGESVNFKSIVLNTSVEYTIGHDECLSKCATCGGCKNADCKEEVCATKCACVHVCENVCSICGGCKDAECTEEACATKCACKEQTLLAYGNAIVEQGKYDADNNLGCATLDSNTWRTKFRYVIDAKTAGKAEFSIIISSTRNGNHPATDVFMTTINGKEYKSEAMSVDDGISYTSFHTIKLGLIDLKEGRNIIEFDHYHITDFATAPVANWGDSVNFKAIVLNTSVEYTIGHDECLSKCATCGGCQSDDCTETVCATKCTCEH